MDGAQRILVGTVGGLWEIGPAGSRPVDALAGTTITALASDREGPEARRVWALIEGRALWAGDPGGGWTRVAAVKGADATCLAATPAGLLVGTEKAHLLRLDDGRLAPVASFEQIEGRKTWYTPWGEPADVRSIAAGLAGESYVNVHVGGVVRSWDGGRSWTPTLDIEVDVHQVVTDPSRPDVVLVAAADGLGVSLDRGNSWQFVTAGLHAHYLRAVTVSQETVLVTASTGPSGRRAAIYRKPVAGGTAFERCRRGLPEWFGDNVDTGCLAARGPVVVFGTEDGQIFRSADGGASWELLANGLPAVRGLTFA